MSPSRTAIRPATPSMMIAAIIATTDMPWLKAASADRSSVSGMSAATPAATARVSCTAVTSVEDRPAVGASSIWPR